MTGKIVRNGLSLSKKMDEKIVLTLLSFFNWWAILHLWFITTMLIRLVRFLANLNISSTLSTLMSLMNEINWILVLAVPRHITYFIIRSFTSTTNYFTSFSSLKLFRNILLKFIRTVQRKNFNINDSSVGIKLLTRWQ